MASNLESLIKLVLSHTHGFLRQTSIVGCRRGYQKPIGMLQMSFFTVLADAPHVQLRLITRPALKQL